MKPLVIDLFCGLGGWSEGFLAEGWDCLGFDIERHQYGEHKYPAQLVLQDVLTLDGRQFKGVADLIVASPPCQEYSYMASPFSRAKKVAAEYRAGVRDVRKLTELFDVCFLIATEAELPVIVENVRGAQAWVGRSRWNYGPFHLWGDVPALMPQGTHRKNPNGGSWFYGNQGHARNKNSKSIERRRASALAAKIPLPLARHIARVYKPQEACKFPLRPSASLGVM